MNKYVVPFLIGVIFAALAAAFLFGYFKKDILLPQETEQLKQEHQKVLDSLEIELTTLESKKIKYRTITDTIIQEIYLQNEKDITIPITNDNDELADKLTRLSKSFD